MPTFSRRAVLALVTAVWAAAVTTGMGLLWSYGSTPGPAGDPPARRPPPGAMRPGPGRATLVMAVHPNCPCTRASLSELARLMTRAGGRVDARVLILSPRRRPKDWGRSTHWETASRIPGVEVVADVAGAEAARFGLKTSGHVVLYDAGGSLRFSGGITAARGHEGENDGLDAAVEAAAGRPALAATHPVFGCPIFDAPDVSGREVSR
jgi:hypothetical protein